MSYYSTIDGHIRARSAKGTAVLRKYFDDWTDPEAEGQVEFAQSSVKLSGLYRNLGRAIEPCLQELYRMNELADANLDEETTDGFEAAFRYELIEGKPYVTVTKPSGETTVACLLDAR